MQPMENYEGSLYRGLIFAFLFNLVLAAVIVGVYFLCRS